MFALIQNENVICSSEWLPFFKNEIIITLKTFGYEYNFEINKLVRKSDSAEYDIPIDADPAYVLIIDEYKIVPVVKLEISIPDEKVFNGYTVTVNETDVTYTPIYIDYVAPEMPTLVIKKKTVYTKLEFRRLFTNEELVLLETKLIDDKQLIVIKDDLNAAEYIDITDTRTISAVTYLVTSGVITEDRKTTILATE